jgi:hypothetical protein
MPKAAHAPREPIATGPDQLDASRFRPETRRRLSAPALRTFLEIADRWGLREEERRLILGLPSRSTYHNWARTARMNGDITLDVDTLTRLSAVLGIYQAGTQDGLLSVRRFLDGARGGVYMPPNAVDAAFTPYTDSDIVLT